MELTLNNAISYALSLFEPGAHYDGGACGNTIDGTPVIEVPIYDGDFEFTVTVWKEKDGTLYGEF